MLKVVFPPAFSPAFASPLSASVCRPSLRPCRTHLPRRHAQMREASVCEPAERLTHARRPPLWQMTHLRKEIVYGLARLHVRGPKRLSTGSRVCASMDQGDCLRARTSARAWMKEIVYGLVHRNLTHLCMRGPKSAGCSHVQA